ncbi:hypothetical protein Ancab_017526 [Ancistrocladus abbreviatus]
MHLPGHFGLLVAFFSVLELYTRYLQIVLGFIFMDCASSLKLLTQASDFGFGFLFFGSFSKLFNVFLFLVLFALGFMALQFGWAFRGFSGSVREFRGMLSDWSTGSSIKNELDCVCHGGAQVVVGDSSEGNGGDQFLEGSDGVVNPNGYGENPKDDGFVLGDEGEGGQGCCAEDEIFDVMALRKMVKVQRRQAYAARCELEKERIAAASAAVEAMSMISRLQNEKSSVQMQANQLERLAEERRLHDQEVIQSLHWIIMKHESDRSLLEDQLKLCMEKLKLYVKGGEGDQLDCTSPSFSGFLAGNRLDDALISSLDLDAMLMNYLIKNQMPISRWSGRK